MKKNDLATFIVYVVMIAIALVVGLLVIRPVMSGGTMPINGFLVIALGIVAGAILNAGLIELGHVLGAKVGHYTVRKSVVLGFGFKRVDGKKKYGFMSFDGLAGETKVVPQDVQKSTLSAYILFPVLLLFVEFIAAMVIIVICQNQEAASVNTPIRWLHVFVVTILTVGGMLYVYDLFPAHIESVTDGYLLVLLAKPANKEAYNNLLLAETASENGEPIPETPIYQDVTDFTAYLNLLAAYRHLSEGRPEEALPIIELSLKEEANVSSSTKMHARALKLAILLEQENREKGKKMYAELEDDVKKYIADITTLTALRCYLLIASFVEGSESETNYAVDKAEKAIKLCEPAYKEAEKSLLQYDVDMTRSAHPSWKVYQLPWEEAETKNKEE
ncbi:MAG: hypothetical protein J6O18_08180 [Bacilli bacterium]|nr:hypothetical protein [Bacilli bacterium]